MEKDTARQQNIKRESNSSLQESNAITTNCALRNVRIIRKTNIKYEIVAAMINIPLTVQPLVGGFILKLRWQRIRIDRMYWGKV
jgi:hypothetical protein